VASSKPEKLWSADVPTVMFVATTPFAVNAFLANHIEALLKTYKVVLCTNLDAYTLAPALLNNVEVYHIPFARRVAIGIDLKTLAMLTMLVRRVKPAVIHSITPKAGLLAMLAGLIGRAPNRWHTFTGQVWVTKLGLSRSILKAFDQLIVMLATKVFADSASQCCLLQDEGIVEDDQIEILGYGSIAGVDIKRFSPDTFNRERMRQQMDSDANTCVFLFVGRLAKDKGVFDLIQSFLELSTTVHGIELWVVGPDEERLLQTLQEVAEGCVAPIRWLGETTTPEQFMVAADVLLLPSYREGFGSVIIEGAACGIPAIAYRINGVTDAIVDGRSGLLVEVGQTAAFAAAMTQMALDKELRLFLGRQARDRAVQDFSSKKVTDAWIEFYRRYLNQQDEEIF
jgi:glycosyltransferase involved in cell wall biosynthesis